MAAVWNVFLPYDFLNQPAAYLKGYTDEAKGVICITGFCHDLIKTESEDIVGRWRPFGTPLSLTRQSHGYKIWVDVSQTQSATEPIQCHVYTPGDSAQPSRCVFVLFDQTDLLSSYMLQENVDTGSHIAAHLLSIYRCPDNATNQQKISLLKVIITCLKCMLAGLLHIFTAVLAVLEGFVSMTGFKWILNKVQIEPPVTVNHVSRRLQRCRKVHPSNLVMFDASGQQLMDSVIGVAVMALIMYNGSADSIAQFIIHWADDTAQNLNDLLHWLMGAPAGLKLNAQLTGYLGHFFLYHVYLWKGYLSLLRPVLGWVVWCAACSGVLGVTMQLCLVQDILSMLTIHIYCFYVYAARIYSLQVYALSSLWRLFRGKKWNVLRLRVDSALYNMDQLFVGTLLFTVLLFLLPTTALYYFVFTALRLLLLSFHGLLSLCVLCLSDIPACTLVLRMLHSKAVTGDLMFTVTSGGTDENSLMLSMQTTQLPVPELYRWAQSHLRDGQKHQQKYTWLNMLKRLATGSLVYPWVSPNDADHKEKYV